jgi:hypothetical protein
MAQLQAVYDPSLVNLLVPTLVASGADSADSADAQQGGATQ